MKNLLFYVLIFMCFQMNSQNKNEAEKVKTCINSFFEVMHKADTLLINKVTDTTLILQTIFVNKNKETTLITSSKKNFLKAISNKNPNDIWFEKLMSFNIKIDTNMANVWAPYEFYLNGEFSHCGVNSFQLFKNNGNWEIIYIVDTRRKVCN